MTDDAPSIQSLSEKAWQILYLQAWNDVEYYKELGAITLEKANIGFVYTEVIKEPAKVKESWDFSDQIH
jgi:hypothetical protein